MSDDSALVKGAKHSLVLNFRNNELNRANIYACQIIEMGESGLKISEVIEIFQSEIDAADLLLFIENLSSQGLISLSSSPKPRTCKRQLSSTLDFLWIEVTTKCNLRCIHCYAESDSTLDISPITEELKRVIGEAAALGCRKLQLTGGECTLRDDLNEILIYAKSSGFEFIEIFTNGTLITEEDVRFFAQERINVALSMAPR